MRIRKRLVVCFAGLLAGIGLAIPATVNAASIPVTCGTQSGGSGAAGSPITDVRVGHHTEEGGFDRIVFQFEGSGIPSWTAIPKSSALFYTDPKGTPVQLEGMAGIKLTLFSIPMGSYTGLKDFDPDFPPLTQLAEARLLGDFEGYVTWGLGLERQSCKRIFTLSGPSRLVIDVPTS
jgi:hypothetical protein